MQGYAAIPFCESEHFFLLAVISHISPHCKEQDWTPRAIYCGFES